MRRGMTLLEMMVACALFMVFIVLSGGLIVHMLGSYRQGERIVRPLQEARNAMGLMSSTVRSTLNVLSPAPTVLAEGSNSITLEIYTDATRYVMISHYSNDDQTVRFTELFPDGTVKSQKILMRHARLLNFRKQPRDPIVVIDLVTIAGTQEVTADNWNLLPTYDLQTLIFMRASR